MTNQLPLKHLAKELEIINMRVQKTHPHLKDFLRAYLELTWGLLSIDKLHNDVNGCSEGNYGLLDMELGEHNLMKVSQVIKGHGEKCNELLNKVQDNLVEVLNGATE